MRRSPCQTAGNGSLQQRSANHAEATVSRARLSADDRVRPQAEPPPGETRGRRAAVNCASIESDGVFGAPYAISVRGIPWKSTEATSAYWSVGGSRYQAGPSTRGGWSAQRHETSAPTA